MIWAIYAGLGAWVLMETFIINGGSVHASVVEKYKDL